MLEWFLDLDGVIINFVGGVIKWYKLKCSEDDIVAWGSLYDYWPGTIPEFWEGLPESFWENLDFTPEGREIIDMVAHLKPTILTAPPWTGATGKQRWIQKNMPEYFDHDRYLIGPSKTCVARHGAVLIDDADHNIEPWIEAEGHGILVPRPWNKHRGYEVIKYVQAMINVFTWRS